MQIKAVGAQKAKTCLFQHELDQIFILVLQCCRDALKAKEEWALPILQRLPKSFRMYSWEYGYIHYKLSTGDNKDKGYQRVGSDIQSPVSQRADEGRSEESLPPPDNIDL